MKKVIKTAISNSKEAKDSHRHINTIQYPGWTQLCVQYVQKRIQNR